MNVEKADDIKVFSENISFKKYTRCVDNDEPTMTLGMSFHHL